jgi:hypothetical protein
MTFDAVSPASFQPRNAQIATGFLAKKPLMVLVSEFTCLRRALCKNHSGIQSSLSGSQTFPDIRHLPDGISPKLRSVIHACATDRHGWDFS